MLALFLTLLVVLIIAGLCYWAVTRVAAAFGLPAPIVVLVEVALVVVVVLALVALLFGGADLPLHLPRR